jgi:GNAT superfamily N-acetyltransferase
MKIREFTPDDYPAIVDVHNTIYLDRPTTVAAWRAIDQQRSPKYRHKRWVAEEGGQIVGTASYSQHLFNYHPQKFSIHVIVLPVYRRRGFGAALFDQIMVGLRPYDPQTLRADGYSNQLEGVRFLEERGFVEVFREYPLHLNVDGFDPAPYAGLEAKLRAQGIEIKTLTDLEADPERNRKVYELFWELTGEIPGEGTVVTPMPFDDWVNWTIKDPLVPHEGYFIAMHGDEYVGLSEFGKYPDQDGLQGGLVGVKRAYQRRGIALAMQVRGIAYARENGHPIIKTSTGTINKPMFSLYDRLGFVRQPDWIQFEKVIQKL